MTFSGPVEFLLGNVGRDAGTLTCKGKFESADLISGEVEFSPSVGDRPSKHGTFKAVRVARDKYLPWRAESVRITTSPIRSKNWTAARCPPSDVAEEARIPVSRTCASCQRRLGKRHPACQAFASSADKTRGQSHYKTGKSVDAVVAVPLQRRFTLKFHPHHNHP